MNIKTLNKLINSLEFCYDSTDECTYNSNDVELSILKKILKSINYNKINYIFIKYLNTNPFKIVLLINKDIELKLTKCNIYINFISPGTSVRYSSYNIFKEDIIKNINEYL